MLKKILAVLAMLYAAAAFAAVDVNTAKAADLDGVKGIGPVMSKRILDERKKGKFKSWEDLISRVKGLGESSAAKLSAEGLTVDGTEFKATAAKKEEKKDAKADKKDAKADAKKDAKEAKAEAKEAKKDAKEAKADAKDAKKEAKEAKADAKTATAAKPAASAKK